MNPVRIEVREGESLLAAMYREEVFVAARCAGQGRCRGCRVHVLAGPPGVEGRPEACAVDAPGWYEIVPDRPLSLPAARLPDRPPTGRRLGLALDLGTTSLAAALVDLDTGSTRGEARMDNPQVAYGADVLSRIGYGRDPDHRSRLADLVRRGATALLAGLLEADSASPGDVVTVRAAGNAGMTLLFLGRDPTPLGAAPFRSGLAAEGPLQFDPEVLGLSHGGTGGFLPALGGHVGSDITAGLLAAGLTEGRRPAVLVDLGTNGEVALATDDGLLVASAAAGPAFEGGSIGHGSAARPGAVERVDLHEGELVLVTIDGAPPRSWCGSGVIEIVAALLERGDLDATGRLGTPPDLPVPFDQADVREVQLAKGAVAAAMEILCREAGIAATDLARVVLTGAFGARLRSEPARRIGLLPAGPPVEVRHAGALTGARRALLSGGDEAARAIASRARHVALGDREDFQDVFVEQLALGEAAP